MPSYFLELPVILASVISLAVICSIHDIGGRLLEVEARVKRVRKPHETSPGTVFCILNDPVRHDMVDLI
jgi:hypothetical protein